MVFRSICKQEFLHGLKIAKLLRQGTLAATNRRRNPKSPGKSDMMKLQRLSTADQRRDEMNPASSGSQGTRIVVFFH